MARSLRVLALCAAAAAVTSACGNGATKEAFPPECGLPSPAPGVDASEVPEEFLLKGSQVRQVSDEKDLFVVALNVPLGVQEALDAYREKLAPPKFEIVSEDNEGFEAEMYLRRAEDGNLMAVQIRRPGCAEASAVFVTVAKRSR